MNAYSIECDDDNSTLNIDGCATYCLPFVSCTTCGEQWGDGYFEYPAFDFDIYKENDAYIDNDDCIPVSMEEFHRLRQQILDIVKRPVWLSPGSSLGMFSGTAITTKLDDVAWGGFNSPHISISAFEKICSRGIELTKGRTSIRCRGKKIETHTILHIEPLSYGVYTPQTIDQLSYKYCETCGGYMKVNPRAKVKDGDYRLLANKIPNNAHLFRLMEDHQIIATEVFAETVLSLGLTGIKFVKYGEFV